MAIDTVTSGPCAPLAEDDRIEFTETPFSYQLDRALRDLQVSVQPFQSLPREIYRLENGFIQLNVRKFLPKELAQMIREKCGSSVQFGELALPRALECITISYAGNIWVRHLLDYQVCDDGLYQRWDVLVRPK